MFTGHALRRTDRRGLANASALAALVALGCAAPPVQPPATSEALQRVAALVRRDVFQRPASLGPLFARRAVLYFFRTGCEYCVADVAAAPALASTPGFPSVVLISREPASRLRAVLGPRALPNLVVVSDSEGGIMGSALPTHFVPRVVAIERGRVRLDVTGTVGGGIARAALALGNAGP